MRQVLGRCAGERRNGIHTITVKGELTKDASTNATAEAAVGNRTLVIEPTHAAPNETNG